MKRCVACSPCWPTARFSVKNAEEVIEALNTPPVCDEDDEYAWQPEPIRPRFLRIRMHRPPGNGHLGKDVNIRVPIAVVCGGVRLGMLMPGLGHRINARLRARGVDFDWAASARSKSNRSCRGSAN